MNRLYSIYDRADPHSFELIQDSVSLKKKDIDPRIEELESTLQLIIPDFALKRVYIDIQDRLLFIILLLTLKKLNASVILMPIEIKPDVFFESEIMYITDNKKHPEALMINNKLEIITGDNFNKNNLRNFENRYDIFLYTSGSTGKSKLIGKNASNIITEVMELYRLFKPLKKDLFYITPPLYHIYGFLFGLMLPLYSSSAIDLTYHFTPESVAEYVKEKKVDFFVSIPSYYKMLEELHLQHFFKKAKKLFSSSAQLPLDISDSFYNKSVLITEVYGSTETGGIAHRVSAETIQWQLFSYVQIPGHSLNNEVELVIDSPAISVDYDKETGFNTGDVVNFNSDNNFILLGRNTKFVKIHGKRVDLGFILSRFREYIKNTYSINILEDQVFAGLKDDKVFIIVEGKVVEEPRKLIEDLRAFLPGYAVPRYIIFNSIPRNEMGKINKQKIDELIKGL